jgi:hypothetical protein
VSSLIGPKEQGGFGSKINCIQMKLLYFENRYKARASKSAKINGTFKVNFPCQKTTEFFQKKISSKNINLGDHFMLKAFFSRLNY